MVQPAYTSVCNICCKGACKPNVALGGRNMDWIDLAQNRDRCWAYVNAVMNFGFHKMRGISRLVEDLLGSQEELCTMDVVV
jgi:hypothetical protein